MDGLSPRVRGNRAHRLRMDVCQRSIPARAGEPRCEARNHRAFAVYPRACGGTGDRPFLIPPAAGLSPRVRGNRMTLTSPGATLGSIPARAGEPRASAVQSLRSSVYPRACGGTSWRRRSRSSSLGLSPRVRGNRAVLGAGFGAVWSIPARAGEPTSLEGTW